MLVRSMGWVMLLALGLVVVGCNATDDSASTTTGLSTGSTITSDPVSASQTTTTVSFDDEVDEARDALEHAGTDLCAVLTVTHQQLHVNPQTPAEVRDAVDLLVAIIDAMRSVAPSADRQLFQTAAKRLRAEAMKAEYSVTWIQNEQNHTALNDPGFVAATSRLETKYQANCQNG